MCRTGIRTGLVSRRCAAGQSAVQNGRLSAVIDFADSAAWAIPAPDLMIAWNLFSERACRRFAARWLSMMPPGHVAAATPWPRR